jgi:hypothetical protein
MANITTPLNQQEEIKATTIKITDKTRERLEHLKEHKEESADSLINKALNILNICVRSPSLASKILKDIEKTKKRKELLENPDKIIPKKKNQVQLNPINAVKK